MALLRTVTEGKSSEKLDGVIGNVGICPPPASYTSSSSTIRSFRFLFAILSGVRAVRDKTLIGRIFRQAEKF